MKREYKKRSLKWISLEYDYPFVDTCALRSFLPFGEKKGSLTTRENILHFREHLERGNKCFITKCIAEECRDPGYWTTLLELGKNIKWKEEILSLINLFEEKGMVLDLRPTEIPYYKKISPYLCGSDYYYMLEPTDQDLFLSALMASFTKYSISIITNDSKIHKTWREFLGELINSKDFGMFVRRGLDAFELLH